MTTHFANVPKVLISYLRTLPGLGGVDIRLPDPTPTPFILVVQIPSGGDDYLTARPIVDVEVFHTDPGLAIDFSRLVHDRMLRLRHTAVAVGGENVVIDHVRTINGFGWADYEDPNLHRVLAEYEIHSMITAQSL